MKKSISFLTVIVLATILLSFFLNISIYRKQIAFQRGILNGQATSAADKLEQTLLKFENDVNALLYSNSLMNLDFSSEDSKQAGLTEVERLFFNYRDLIKNIVIEDSNQHVLNLSYNKKNILLIDPYLTQKQTELISNSVMQKTDNEYIYTFPVFFKKQLAANLVFTFDFPKYFASVLNEYYHDAHFFQWVVEEDGNLLYSNTQPKLQYTHLPVIHKDILTETNDFVKHNVSIDNKNVKVYSAFIPFHAFGNRMGVFFSMQQRFIFSLLFTRILLVSLLNAAVLIFLLMLIYRSGGKDFAKGGQKTGKLAQSPIHI